MARPLATWLVVPLVVLAMLVAPTAAHAQRHGNAQPPHRVRIDLHVDFAWYGAFGLGARVDIPVVPDGFLRPGGSLQDDFVISPGLDVFFWNFHRYDYACGGMGCTRVNAFGTFVALEVAAQWNLYIGDWSFFPEAGLAFVFGDAYYWRDRYYDGYVWPFLGGGARWHFNTSNSLLMRVTWPAGFQIGITF